MQVFRFNTCFQKQRVKIMITEKGGLALAVMLTQLFIKFFFQFKDRALIRNGMGMDNRMLEARFSNQYPSCM